jgi:pimeloyl-ACP methyl ester carboxylesterase
MVVVAMTSVIAAEVKTAVSTNEEKVIIIDDSLKMSAWLMRDTLQSDEPLVILLHQKGLTHESYQPFIVALTKFVESDSLHRPMPTILNFDLRSHGKSIHRRAGTVSYATMSHAEYEQIPNDVAQVVTALETDRSLDIDSTNMIIIGASIGANTAAILTEKLPGVRRIVMLSPGKVYHGLEPGRAVAQFKGEMLIMAAKGDIYSKESSEFFFDSNKQHSTLKWFGDGEHGTEIINGDKHAMSTLIEWIMRK